MQPLEAGEPTVIGPYRLLGRLGSGGMGRVYLGRSAGGRTVAVKSVHPQFALDAEFRARFKREVAAARRVGGDWTAPVLDADPEAPVPWVATGYVAGPSLAEVVSPAPGTLTMADDPGPAAGNPLPESTVCVLGASLAEALAHVHALGLVHRDVKPSNVLLTMDGPRLIDFGIARATDGTASLTSTGASIGSPGYMAPEQILGQGVTGAADVFSLGAVLAYGASGRPPFPGDSSAALLYRVVYEEPELDGLGGELLDVVTRCLSKTPAVRPTPQEVAHRLAPQGAARSVAAGWLPGPLVAEVGRSAIRLLDLEVAPGPQEATMALRSRPTDGHGTPQTGGGYGTPHADERKATPSDLGNPSAEPALGVFGPPDPSYLQNNDPYPPREGASQSSGSPSDAKERAPQDGRPADPDPTEPQKPDAASRAAGRLSVSVTATAVPSADSKSRRLSCTVALAVAGALAAVTVGSVFVFDLLPGSGGDVSGKGPTGTDTPPTSHQPSNPHGGSVPSGYLGSWQGDATATGIPDGTFELVVRQAKPGARFATLTQTDVLGGVCKDVLTLKKADGDRIVATGRGDKSNAAHCSQAAHTIYLKPVGDDLKYTSDDPAAGNPEARLSKTD